MPPQTLKAALLTPATMFVGRLALAWGVAVIALGVLTLILARGAIPRAGNIVLVMLVMCILVAIGVGITHVQRVQRVAGRTDAASLANRHRRQIEIPYEFDEAFRLVEAAIRELPRIENVRAIAAERFIEAEVLGVKSRMDLRRPGRPLAIGLALGGVRSDLSGRHADGHARDLIRATLQPGTRSSTLILECEAGFAPWLDWFLVDDACSLENCEFIARAVARRTDECCQRDQAVARQTSIEKELADARLALLQAQVEPHFLYNTLANAQLLTRSDPAKADQMLGQLIGYLRCSLPRTGNVMSSFVDELQRATAYLELMKIRMGERLKVVVDVDEAAKPVGMPPMMLQTLVENAIKHGLEPKTGGGTIWIRARLENQRLTVTVADDGRGLSCDTSGTGIGLKNVRERLHLAFGDRAGLSIAGNFPAGLAATLTLPIDFPENPK